MHCSVDSLLCNFWQMDHMGWLCWRISFLVRVADVSCCWLYLNVAFQIYSSIWHLIWSRWVGWCVRQDLWPKICFIGKLLLWVLRIVHTPVVCFWLLSTSPLIIRSSLLRYRFWIGNRELYECWVGDFVLVVNSFPCILLVMCMHCRRIPDIYLGCGATLRCLKCWNCDVTNVWSCWKVVVHGLATGLGICELDGARFYLLLCGMKQLSQETLALFTSLSAFVVLEWHLCFIVSFL